MLGFMHQLCRDVFNYFGSKFIDYENKYEKGAPITYTLISSLFFVIVSKLVRSLHGLGSSQIFFFRSSISLLFNTTLISFMDHNPYTNDKALHKLLMARCIIAGIGHYCFYQAMYMLDVSEAITIFQTSPFWTTILAGIILKERLKPNLFLTLICSFIGILLIIQPPFVKDLLGITFETFQGNQAERFTGFIFGGFYSFSVSVAMVVVKKLSSGIQNSVIIHYALISGTFIAGLDLIQKGEFNFDIFLPENFICVIFIAFFNYSIQLMIFQFQLNNIYFMYKFAQNCIYFIQLFTKKTKIKS